MGRHSLQLRRTNAEYTIPLATTNNSSFVGASVSGVMKATTITYSSQKKYKTDGPGQETHYSKPEGNRKSGNIIPDKRKKLDQEVLSALETLESKYQDKVNTLTGEIQRAIAAHAKDIELWKLERSRNEELTKNLEAQIVSLKNQEEVRRVEQQALVEKHKKQLKAKQDQFELAFSALEAKAKECIQAEQKKWESKLQHAEETWKLKLEKATFELSSSACLQQESSRKEFEHLKRELEAATKQRRELEASKCQLEFDLHNLKQKEVRSFAVQVDTVERPPVPPTTKQIGTITEPDGFRLSQEEVKKLGSKVAELAAVIKDKEERLLEARRDNIGVRDRFREYIKKEMALKRSLADGV